MTHYLFNDIEIEASQVLYVIGNGFDLAHGIKSSYKDFYKWVKDGNFMSSLELMDVFFSTQREFWGDIEKALGEYDETQIVDYCKPDEEIDYDHPTRSVAAVEDGPDWLFKPELDGFLEAFHQWVDSIDLNDAASMYTLHTEGRYLTFNYTETLEKAYGISSERIVHVHGCRLTDNEYIIGHNNQRDHNEAYADESELYFYQDTCAKIIRWMNELVKDTISIIGRHKDFFNSLSDVKHVIVYGHSFYEVDWPYLLEIVKQIGSDIPWIIGYHSDSDLVRIDRFIQEAGLTNVQKINK